MPAECRPVKEKILAAATLLAEQLGYQNIRRDAVALAAGCGQGTVNFHFADIAALKKAVLKRAVTSRNLRLVAQMIVSAHPRVPKLSAELRAAALASL